MQSERLNARNGFYRTVWMKKEGVNGAAMDD